MTMGTVSLPAKIVSLFDSDRGSFRYRVMYGGRGSGKSYAMAMMSLIWGYREPLRVLCTREVQASIKESMHAELKGIIEGNEWLSGHYEVLKDSIRGANGTEFIFRGLYDNAKTIKSLSNIDLCIVEEAQDISRDSWGVLLPTIRKELSEVWVAYNPKSKSDPVDVIFRQRESEDLKAIQVNFYDNPWFPDALKKQMEMDKETLSHEEFLWIWFGRYLERSKAQVFADKYTVRDFSPSVDWDGPYQGMDWGFSVDPTVAVRVWIHDRCLYVEYEAGEVALELDHTPRFLCENIPDFADYVTRADSARPESISHVNRKGLPLVVPCSKWAGSIEDGISFIRSFKEVVIHTRCEGVLFEFENYSYKTNRAGDVLSAVKDEHNHYIDAIRYALQPVIRDVKDLEFSWV